MPAADAAGPVVVLTGPTGSGKSECGLQLARHLASRLAVEIVSVDSAQVYRGMDIGTAKPTAAQRLNVPHHLIDIRDPSESYSAGDFVREASGAIDAIHARGALPLLVGGTMLYLRALHAGLAVLPPASSELRREIDALAATHGWPGVHAELMRVDPVAAARIAPQDAQRLQRALEVYRLTGVPISEWQRRSRHHHEADAPRQRYRWLRYVLQPESRQDLRQRLQSRFDAMLRAGLVEEVRALYARGDLTPQHSSIRAVGYRQLWSFFAGQVSLEQASTAAVNATAQFAKRQLTWLRREPELTPVGDISVGVLESMATQIWALARHESAHTRC
jgi:tRNA dimethylallyltransferase